jgi:neutral ceramidase
MKKGAGSEADLLLMDVKKFDITPPVTVSLLGYFNDCRSTGILDPLCCRMAALRHEHERLLFVQIDSCLIMKEDSDRIKSAITRDTGYRVQDITVFTNHTHTAPALADFFGARREGEYLLWLTERIVETAGELRPEEPCRVSFGTAIARGLAHNRRWYMRDGSVATNPPKCSPLMVRPEGAVDGNVQVLRFQPEANASPALFVNISNHTDTVGGSKISADWTGFMERYIQERTGTDIVVFPLIAPQGNINHFDFHSPEKQTSYEETERIGRSYAESVLEALEGTAPVEISSLHGRIQTCSILPREIDPSELEAARELASQEIKPGEDGDSASQEIHSAGAEDLTAEELFFGDSTVNRIFARELLDFAACLPDHLQVPLQVLKIGSVAICALPGEPFVEI